MCNEFSLSLKIYVLGSVSVAEWGCKSMTQLASDEGNRMKLASAGAGDAITSILSRYSEYESTLEACFRAIVSIAASESSRLKIKSNQLCEMMIKAMKVCYKNKLLAELSCLGISVLARDSTINSKLEALECCEVVTNIIQEHNDIIGVVQSACTAVSWYVLLVFHILFIL